MQIVNKLRLPVYFRVSCHRCQRSYSDLKVLYFGTDNFSLSSLKRLSEEKLARLEVVTSFKARNNPIKAFAAKNQIKIYDWADLLLNENRHICREFDLGLVVSFGHLIPEAIINSFKNGMLNVHASLLPKYRGASPIVYAIRNGDKETGVSIMRIKPKKFDVGEILTTQKVLIPDDVMMPELHDHLSSIGADLLVDCISDLSRLRPIEQDNSKASYAPKIDNEFCKVRWHEMTSLQVWNLHRSIFSFKNILTTFNNEQVKLIDIARHEISQIEGDISCQPGDILFCKKTKKLLVKCADQKCIELKQISIAKKKAFKVMSATDFINGYLSKCEKSEWKFQ